jgi:hypothetical protein
MQIRDRIIGLRRVPAGSLRPNPLNWRLHPARQRAALQGALAEIGYASALLARELPDGSLELIDGHLRAETTPDSQVPVLVLDLDEREAKLLLATFDPLSSLAGADFAALESLLGQVEFQDAALRLLVDELAAQKRPSAPTTNDDVRVPELYQVVVECGDETRQREVFERLRAEGFRCRLMNL